jgi:hypothetical protein
MDRSLENVYDHVTDFLLASSTGGKLFEVEKRIRRKLLPEDLPHYESFPSNFQERIESFGSLNLSQEIESELKPSKSQV